MNLTLRWEFELNLIQKKVQNKKSDNTVKDLAMLAILFKNTLQGHPTLKIFESSHAVCFFFSPKKHKSTKSGLREILSRFQKKHKSTKSGLREILSRFQKNISPQNQDLEKFFLVFKKNISPQN